ncbi:MAG: dienelactone hydrolase family protein, partial [Planctomycetes bacterium]|nr:dienelactone hydrolase family protein [Planctomycetota bacterium]
MPSRWDTVQVGGADMRCYVAAPDSAGPYPAIVVIQHAGGVDEFVQLMTDRFAGEGYVAIAPDLYHRDDPSANHNALTKMVRLRDPNI